MFFFFISGRRLTTKKMGLVAEFCPVCRRITSFAIDRIGVASTIFLIHFGSGRQIGHLGTCQECGCSREMDILHYPVLEKRPAVTIEALAKTTSPAIAETYKERLELEKQICMNPRKIAPGTRRELLLEPFKYLSADTEKHCHALLNADQHSNLAFLCTLLWPFVFFLSIAGINSLFKIDIARHPSYDKILGPALGLLLLAGIILTLVLMFLSSGRYINKVIMPSLIRALTPLRPSLEELQEALATFKNAGLIIGRKISARKLHAAIEDKTNNPGNHP